MCNGHESCPDRTFWRIYSSVRRGHCSFATVFHKVISELSKFDMQLLWSVCSLLYQKVHVVSFPLTIYINNEIKEGICLSSQFSANFIKIYQEIKELYAFEVSIISFVEAVILVCL